MDYLPFPYERFKKEFPEIEKGYEKLATLCHAAGPLDEKMRRLIKLGIALGVVLGLLVFAILGSLIFPKKDRDIEKAEIALAPSEE